MILVLQITQINSYTVVRLQCTPGSDNEKKTTRADVSGEQ